VTPRHDVEGQVGVLTADREVADLVGDQQLVRVDRTMHDLAIAALALRGFEQQHQIGRAEEAGFVNLLGGGIADANREMGFTDARGFEEHDVLGALDEDEIRTSSIRAISRMLLPCRLKTRISTASSATSMRPSASEYPTLGWVNFQSAIPGSVLH